MGAAFEATALARVVEASGRYPYFIQEFGTAIWDVAPETPFTNADADLAIVAGRGQLDAGVLSLPMGPRNEKGKSYLRAMAQDGDGGRAQAK